MAVFDIDAKDVVKATAKLERLHRSALPVSVRGALNDAAFDMKKNTIEKHFKKNFTIRSRTFVRSHSRALKSPKTRWNRRRA